MKHFVIVGASLLIGALCLGRVEAQIPVLSDAQNADIVQALLEIESEAQRSEFLNIKGVSSSNIEFLPNALISKLGFFPTPAREIDNLKVDHVLNYLLIRPIKYLGEGRVSVTLARITEGRPCFGPSFSREESFTYEFTMLVQDGSPHWAGRLVRKSLPFSLGKSLYSKGLR